MSTGRITPHFAAEEFACKDGTPYPARWVEPRLRPLCALLEAIRTELAAPVRVVSGYRTAEYNKRIGGARASQHVEGRAADIVCSELSAPHLHSLVLDLYRRGRLPGLGGIGEYPSFVHVDTRPGVALARWHGRRRSNTA